MYPNSPTVEQWRRSAADMARLAGVPVPDWYDGTMTTVRRLNDEGKTDISAAITWMQNAYVLENTNEFPQANIDTSRAFIAKNPSATAWAGGFAQIENGLLAQVGDFATEYGKEIVKAVLDPAAAIEDVKGAFGINAVKQDPKGFATVAAVGVGLGVLAWWGWNKLKKGGV